MPKLVHQLETLDARLYRSAKQSWEDGAVNTKTTVRKLLVKKPSFKCVVFENRDARLQFQGPKSFYAALEYKKPLKKIERGGWPEKIRRRWCVFGPFVWDLNAAEFDMPLEDLRLVLLEAVDRQRFRMERLRRRFAEGIGEDIAVRRETIPESVRMLVWRRDGGRCVSCGSNERLEFDHIIPVIRGGSNTARNVQLLCERCNRSKSSKV